MNPRLLVSLAALVLPLQLSAASVQVVESGFTPLARPDQAREVSPAAQAGPRIAAQAQVGQPMPFLVYPIAGTVGRDLAIPYYVDLDASTSAKLDFDCGDMTFGEHAGHDGYIRSFSEQRIGVPVFAPRDGVVVEVHDSEPDENTDNDPARKANYVVLDHGNGQTTRYAHLRRDSVPFEAGAAVTAGTQIGLVGSSGQSTAPHVHFESRIDGDVYEPMAGPCRAGASNFTSQHAIEEDPMLLGATLSAASFADFRPAPWDEAPATGTFVKGLQTIYVRAEVANVGASTRYRLVLDAPGSGGVLTASSGVLSRYDTSLGAIWWGLNVDLDRVGTWQLRFEINERLQYTFPFTVVASAAQIVNRPPANVTASIEPVALRSGQVAICRAGGELLADPDYQPVGYRFEWRVDGELVRTFTGAARSDALGRQYVVAGAGLSCSVTPSDGVLEGQTSTAYATVEPTRRRAARH